MKRKLWLLACGGSLFAACAARDLSEDDTASAASEALSRVDIPASATAASGATITVPIIALACEAFVSRASTFDCASRHAVRKGSVTFGPSVPALDRAIAIRNEYLRLSFAATRDCGGPGVCRGAYGVIGDQCMAIAQSPFFAGFGSFMGRETTRAEAEATAINDCEVHVGDPGAACAIVVSECPAGL